MPPYGHPVSRDLKIPCEKVRDISFAWPNSVYRCGDGGFMKAWTSGTAEKGTKGSLIPPDGVQTHHFHIVAPPPRTLHRANRQHVAVKKQTNTNDSTCGRDAPTLGVSTAREGVDRVARHRLLLLRPISLWPGLVYGQDSSAGRDEIPALLQELSRQVRFQTTKFRIMRRRDQSRGSA